MRGEGALHLHGCTDRLAGASEGHEEAISLRVDLVAAILLEGTSHQGSILLQHARVALAQVLKQVGGPLDVGEEERDGAHREVVHTESPSLWLKRHPPVLGPVRRRSMTTMRPMVGHLHPEERALQAAHTKSSAC